MGVLKNGNGPTVFLRAELDALPVLRDTELLDACKERIRDTDCVTQPVMWPANMACIWPVLWALRRYYMRLEASGEDP